MVRALVSVASSGALGGIACGTDPGTQAEALREETYVGVIPVFPGDVDGFCTPGFNREPVTFRMHDDATTHCSSETGNLGEGHWVAPEATKAPLPRPCEKRTDHTTLHFCRVAVDATRFRPMTTDPDDVANFYAVLHFEPTCPPGSTKIIKRIVNENTNNQNRLQPPNAPALPNNTGDDVLGNATHLHFCFFQAAATPEQTMTAFPDLGFPYAVFHDFEGMQPGWVLEKRWRFSDDENTFNNNAYIPAEGRSSSEFEKIIENPFYKNAADTYFDMARVR